MVAGHNAHEQRRGNFRGDDRQFGVSGGPRAAGIALVGQQAGFVAAGGAGNIHPVVASVDRAVAGLPVGTGRADGEGAERVAPPAGLASGVVAPQGLGKSGVGIAHQRAEALVGIVRVGGAVAARIGVACGGGVDRAIRVEMADGVEGVVGHQGEAGDVGDVERGDRAATVQHADAGVHAVGHAGGLRALLGIDGVDVDGKAVKPSVGGGAVVEDGGRHEQVGGGVHDVGEVAALGRGRCVIDIEGIRTDLGVGVAGRGKEAVVRAGTVPDPQAVGGPAARGVEDGIVPGDGVGCGRVGSTDVVD